MTQNQDLSSITLEVEEFQPLPLNESRKLNYPYISPTAVRLPLVAVYPQKGSDAPELNVCAQMKACGINCAIMSMGVDKIETGINYAKEYGVKTILAHNHFSPEPSRDGKLQLSYCIDTVSRHMGNSGLGGYLTGALPQRNVTNEFGNFPKKISETDHSRSVFTLFPAHYTDKFQTPADYTEFLQSAETIFLPAVWMVDAPAYTRHVNGWAEIRYREFFNSLETFAMMSRYTWRPFWSTVRCDTECVNGNSSPFPTTGRMLFSALSALAYGAQGIMYNQFRQRVSTNSNTTYPDAPLTLDGTRTEVLENIKTVNSRIKQLEGVFLGSQLIQVAHTCRSVSTPGISSSGDVPFTSEKNDKSILYREFSNPIGPLYQINADGRGVLVSHLCHLPDEDCSEDAQDFLVVVNHETETSQTVVLGFSPYFTIEEVKFAAVGQTWKTTKVAVTETNRTFSYKLAPGECIVFRWR